MKNLEGIIQESIQRTQGGRVWMRILAQAIRIGEFRRHMESYGEQRVSPGWREASGSEPAEMPVGLLLRAAAGVLKTDQERILFEAGRHWLESLGRIKGLLEPRSVSPGLLLYGLFRLQESCQWMAELVDTDSVRVICSPDSGSLSLACRLTDERLWPFLTGILSAIGSAQGRSVQHEVQRDSLQRCEHVFTVCAAIEPPRAPKRREPAGRTPGLHTASRIPDPDSFAGNARSVTRIARLRERGVGQAIGRAVAAA